MSGGRAPAGRGTIASHLSFASVMVVLVVTVAVNVVAARIALEAAMFTVAVVDAPVGDVVAVPVRAVMPVAPYKPALFFPPNKGTAVPDPS